MGFFDELQGKLTNVGNQVTSKVKDSGEQVKLQSEIGSLQRQITQNYQKIGSLYYQDYLRHEGNTSELNPECTAICQVIDSLQASIVEKQKKISQIKEQITCPGCGKSIPADSVFCPFCGTRILHQAAPEVQPAADEAPAAPTESPDTAKDAVEEKPKVKYCTNCGAQLDIDAAFCTNCGAPQN